MSYLITQTFILLLIAGLLGLILGWYLTRISANSARASLQARLKSAESDARELRTELDTAVSVRGQAEAERKQLADELASLKAEAASGSDDSAAVKQLQGQLDECREQLDAATAAPRLSAAPASSAPIASVSAAAAGAAAAISDDDAANDNETDDGAPMLLAADTADVDDLQQIKGIGPKIAGILKDLGILRFEQIAEWTPENVSWVNGHLKFKGRIEREKWIPQAKALLAERSAS
jgi:NADH-quinone oxidoreductase subunit E